MTRLTPESPVAAAVHPSPNHGSRAGRLPDMIILHYTGMPTAAEALERLTNPLAEVSAHYFVHDDGRVLQLVPERRRAWHAGVGSWAGATDINTRSIGVEIVNPGHAGGLPPYPDRQIEAVIRLVRDVARRWSVPPGRLLGHSDVAPARKDDPGELFPWEQLHAAGLGHWVPPALSEDGRFLSRGDAGAPVEAMQAMLALYGYAVPIDGTYGEETECVVRAFQRHFRPARVDGVADAATITTLRDLLASRRHA